MLQIKTQGFLEPVNRSLSACGDSQNVRDSRNTAGASKITVLRATDELLKQNQTNYTREK
jgi:hypothetical protein